MYNQLKKIQFLQLKNEVLIFLLASVVFCLMVYVTRQLIIRKQISHLIKIVAAISLLFLFTIPILKISDFILKLVFIQFYEKFEMLVHPQETKLINKGDFIESACLFFNYSKRLEIDIGILGIYDGISENDWINVGGQDIAHTL